MLFSEMTTKECHDILIKNRTDLGLYTKEQVDEMLSSIHRGGIGNTSTGMNIPTAIITSLDGEIINTCIPLEDLAKFKQY